MDNPFLALDLPQLRRRRSLKWRLYDPDVLPLWVAEMDVLPPDAVRAAVVEALDLGDTGYPFAQDYAEAMAAFAQRRWAWALDPRTARLVPDVMLGIVEVLKLVTGPGDTVVVNPPVYPPFAQFVGHLGRRVVEAPLGGDGRLDLTVLDRTLAEAARSGGRTAYLLCNPHNPTGTVHTPAELTAAGEAAERHGARVVVDEIHAPIVHEGASFTPFLSLPVGAGAFALLSASKAFNLAGMKAALAVAGPEAVPELSRMPEEVGHGATHLGVLAQAAALRDGDAWLEAVLAGLDENRRLLGRLLAEALPEVAYRPPQGTYLAWLDCRGLDLGDDPAAVFLERGRVALSAGPPFGSGGEGHARLNLATSPTVIEQAVERMRRAVDQV